VIEEENNGIITLLDALGRFIRLVDYYVRVVIVKNVYFGKTKKQNKTEKFSKTVWFGKKRQIHRNNMSFMPMDQVQHFIQFFHATCFHGTFFSHGQVVSTLVAQKWPAWKNMSRGNIWHEKN